MLLADKTSVIFGRRVEVQDSRYKAAQKIVSQGLMVDTP